MKIHKFDFIVALYIFGVLCAELLGGKTFPIFLIGHMQFSSSVAIFVLPLVFILPDVVVEVYGRARAQSVVVSGMLCIVLLVLMTTLATHLPPTAHFASSNVAYDHVFMYSIRLAAASLTAFAVSELLDVALFSKLRQALQHRALWLRNIVANVTSQFTDSAIFLSLAFYSLQQGFTTNVLFLIGLLLPYWLVRSLASVLETPLMYAAVWWLRAGSQTSSGVVADAY